MSGAISANTPIPVQFCGRDTEFGRFIAITGPTAVNITANTIDGFTFTPGTDFPASAKFIDVEFNFSYSLATITSVSLHNTSAKVYKGAYGAADQRFVMIALPGTMLSNPTVGTLTMFHRSTVRIPVPQMYPGSAPTFDVVTTTVTAQNAAPTCSIVGWGT